MKGKQERLKELEARSQALYGDLRAAAKEISQVEELLQAEGASMEALQVIKDELGIRTGTWPGMPAQPGCEWCLAGGGA